MSEKPSHFALDWLRRREPFDRAAREAAAIAPAWLADRPPAFLDLGCGAGANLRYLAPRLGGRQRWRVVDHDATLLAAWPEEMRAAGCEVEEDGGRLRLRGPGFEAEVERLVMDLAGGFDRMPIATGTLVTTSALLDLVSETWLAALIGRCRAAQAPLLAALTVDGRIDWPGAPDPDDGFVLAGFAAHQRRDKGFGPALGPQAPARLLELLARAGYRSAAANSDWRLDAALQRELLQGMAAAAIETAPDAQARVRAWQARRASRASEGPMGIGHVDVIARL